MLCTSSLSPPLSSPDKTSPIGHFCLQNDAAGKKSSTNRERHRMKVENAQILTPTLTNSQILTPTLTNSQIAANLLSFITFVPFSGKFPAQCSHDQKVQRKGVWFLRTIIRKWFTSWYALACFCNTSRSRWTALSPFLFRASGKSHRQAGLASRPIKSSS